MALLKITHGRVQYRLSSRVRESNPCDHDDVDECNELKMSVPHSRMGASISLG